MNSLILSSPIFDYSADDIECMDIAESTKVKYRAAWKHAIEKGINLTDPETVLAYSRTLSASESLFFSAVMKAKLSTFETALKNEINPYNATPEQVAKMQAVLWKLDNLRKATPTKHEKGTKTHIWLSREQVEEITALPDLTTVRGLRDYIVLATLLGTGVRREEFTDLTFDDLKQQPTKNGMRDVLSIQHGKGDKQRTIPISAKLARHLKEWKQLAGDGRIARAINKAGKINGSLSPEAVRVIVEKYGSLIGMPDLQPHDCRRTFARLGYDAGVRIEQISLTLGHEDIETTMEYLGIKLDIETAVSDFVPISGD